jgi:uncharacterized protein (DUF2236 family)
MTSVLPSPGEYAALTPRPGSPVWRNFSDVRMMATAGYATLLQVAYPTVGYGVHEYSSFTHDPWGRLLRTLDYVHGSIYGGPVLAGTIGRRVREMHKSIKGVRPDGGRYHAMEPEAFAWVHATLASSVVEGRRHFGRPMTQPEKEAFWSQWLQVGRLIGVRPRDLPSDWAGFEAYFGGVVEEKLAWTPAIPELLETFTQPPPPALPGLPTVPGPLWRLMRIPLGRQLKRTTIALVPPPLRERLDLRLSRADVVAFNAMAAAARASEPFVRGPLREFGPHYVRLRRQALARGDVASRPPGREVPPAGSQRAVSA